MSTRANVIIRDPHTTLYFYRHSDGYPSVTGESLKRFVKGYAQHMRNDAMQSAGWLIIQGHHEYREQDKLLTGVMSGYDWKVGAYEPTDCLHGDVDYIYVIDLAEGTILVRETTAGFWEHPDLTNTRPCEEMPLYSFGIRG